MTPILKTSVIHQLDRLELALAKYADASGKSEGEVLDQKGRDLGIQLFREYQRRQWGGAGRGKGRSLAFAELKGRTAVGEGTRVRKWLRDEYEQSRKFLLAQGRRLKREGLNRQVETNRIRRIRLWQKIVGREVSLRAKGIGVLGASFLWFRKRWTKNRLTGRSQVVFVRNRNGAPLGRVIRGDDFFQIVADHEAADGKHPHLDVSDRYGIVDRAVDNVIADMETYRKRKQMEAFRAAFRSLG